MAQLLNELAQPDNALPVLAMVLLIGAMLATTIRTLRLLALAAGLAGLVWLAFDPQGSVVLAGVALFVLANCFRLGDLLLRGRGPLMPSEERVLLEQVLGVEAPEHQRLVLDLIDWSDAEEGAVLMRQGEVEPPLIFIAGGTATIAHNARLVGVCGPGDFLGEMSLVTGEPANATVTVTRRMRLARFDRDALRQLERQAPEASRAIERALARGLTEKLARMNRAVAALGD